MNGFGWAMTGFTVRVGKTPAAVCDTSLCETSLDALATERHQRFGYSRGNDEHNSDEHNVYGTVSTIQLMKVCK
jgi:hypothetical protein